MARLLLCAIVAGFVWALPVLAQTRPAIQPRVVNIYNFCRNSDDRVKNSQDVLLDATTRQIQLVHDNHLNGTWALQYDALINPKYQQLFKEQLQPADEIGAWWEIPRQLVEKAGLTWRGAHDWDSTANIGFSPGYTPEERKKLVDVYMADFKSIFGRYPATVGSWYIDEVTLAYMADKYGIIASCNCKDQVGTDGYTLWGGYWNQAYYPSRVNAYMPAQTKQGQLDVPIFRMLGSDPIYQYAGANGIYSLEPVYPRAGGSAAWVDWFMRNLIHQPSLAFAYTQAGQENSFGWNAMSKGLTLQMHYLAEHAKAGDTRVETLEKSGQWFRSTYELTPATSFVCMDDWQNKGRKSVWYNSRYYRINLLWEGPNLVIRDLHRFDEKLVSPTHDAVLKTRSLAYGTLPIVEGIQWADKGRNASATFAVLSGNQEDHIQAADDPVVKELNSTDLAVTQGIDGGATLSIACAEKEITFSVADAAGHPLQWALQLHGNKKQADAITHVTADRIQFHDNNADYQLPIMQGHGTCEQASDGSITLRADAAGILKVGMDTLGTFPANREELQRISTK
jgi:hypothetical protein